MTKDEAMRAYYGQELHFTGKHPCRIDVGPRGGKTVQVTRVRVTGACKTWKTRPEDFRLPVKYGLYESTAVEEWNASSFHLAENCPLDVEQSA